MNKRLIFVCFAYIAASAVGQRSPMATEARPAIVRQVDHIIVRVDTVADAKALWSLFSEKLNLPIAWPPADYKGFFSGGVSLGNVNLEFAHDSDEPGPPHPRDNGVASAKFSGLGLEPEPLPQAIAELERLRVRHGTPDSYQKEDENGNRSTLWTTVYLDELSKKDMNIFLCEYAQDLFLMSNPPRRDTEENRRYLKDQLKQRGGGPIGIDSVKEIVIETSHYEATLRTWEKLLGLNAADSRGELHPTGGPAIQLTPSRRNGIQSIVVRVANLERARRFLQTTGLFGHDMKSGIGMDRAKLLGIAVEFTQ